MSKAEDSETKRVMTSLPAELYSVVVKLAEALSISISAATRLLIKRGAENSPEVDQANGNK